MDPRGGSAASDAVDAKDDAKGAARGDAETDPCGDVGETQVDGGDAGPGGPAVQDPVEEAPESPRGDVPRDNENDE